MGVKCQQCGTENIDGALFCDECGASLSAAAALQLPQAAEQAEPQEATLTEAMQVAVGKACPSCGHTNPQDARFCEDCGAALVEVPEVEKPQGAPAAPAVAPPAVMAKLITDEGNEIQLDFGAKSELLIGRADPVSRVFPDVDLTPHGGYEAGVSRKHCIIRYANGQFTVEDLESTNGTKLNGRFIQPKVPHQLNDGDELVLGALRLRFSSR
ncbi:MAG: FHA domain-containing protein [Armatimonadota bacterium]|nr:FHA domain-containing protein [Armatimonadota bacterium]MCX7778179.1 FHA domain-containing protein [Armatimonadota bacterium]MDW8025656.1 FHA domain-containing protein [Armatimonadota bacterium]